MDEIILARQPIFDTKLQVKYYELLYRSGSSQTGANFIDGDQATTVVLINLFAELGFQEVTSNQPAFVNLTRNLLLSDTVSSFPKDKVVIEVLENIEVDDTLIDKVKSLKEAGYAIALDDFVYSESWVPLMEIADFIKLDVFEMDEAVLKTTLDACKKYPVKLLAEKIETHEMFEKCIEMGFELFQGYFLCKPKIVKGASLAASKAIVLNILSKIQDPESEVAEITEILGKDAALSYKLLKVLNSAAYSLPRQIDSLHEAVVLLGREQIGKLASMIMLTNVSDKPNELMTMALARARHCELIAEGINHNNKNAFFTIGLFSLLDALMDQPIEALLDNIPLHEDLVTALLQQKGDLGECLHAVKLHERGKWDEAKLEKIEQREVQHTYLEAIKWANDTMASLQG